MFNLRNFILLSLAVLTIVLLSQESETTNAPPARVDAQLQENSDYYITGMRNTQFDEMGKPAYRLEAARVTHYVETDTAKIEKPHFFYFAEGELPWELTANTGTLGNDPARNEEHLELQDQVIARRPMEDGSFLVVTTDSLDVFPDSNEVDTKSPVKLDAGGSHLESTGMRAFLNEEKIELQTAVKGSHE